MVLTGRLKDIIIRKGENISAKEIEDLLYTHPKVGDVAVVGLPDRERGERVCAVVETAAGASSRSPSTRWWSTSAAAGLMKQKVPEQLEVVDALPRNETLNKVLKYKLRDELADRPFPGLSGPTPSMPVRTLRRGGPHWRGSYGGREPGTDAFMIPLLRRRP